jgi:hypothetical protein
VLMPTPVRRTIGALALRVRVPRNRPGVPDQRPPMDWARLRRVQEPGEGAEGLPARQRLKIVLPIVTLGLLGVGV